MAAIITADAIWRAFFAELNNIVHYHTSDVSDSEMVIDEQVSWFCGVFEKN